jgi:hypothetical protein
VDSDPLTFDVYFVSHISLFSTTANNLNKLRFNAVYSLL